MDLAWLMQPIPEPAVAILAVLPWVAGLLTVAVLLPWVLAAGYAFRERRCLAEPHKKAAAQSQPPPPEAHRRLSREDVMPSALTLRAAGPQ